MINNSNEERQTPTPEIDSSVYIAEGATVLGDVTIGKGCGVWYNSVIRGDEDKIVIEDNTNIQDCAVLHCDHAHPVHIGKNVTIGHGAIVHGCSVGDNTLIGMGAIILNDAKIGKNCIIGAGALITQGKVLPDNSLAFGNPAKVIRTVTKGEVDSNINNAKSYVKLAQKAKNAKK